MRELRTLEGHTDRVLGVALSGDGRLAVSASWDQTLKVWEVAGGRELTIFTAEAPLCCCALSWDKETIVAGDSSGVIHYLRVVLPHAYSATEGMIPVKNVSRFRSRLPPCTYLRSRRKS